MSVRVLCGDAIAKLRDLPADSVHCVVTSPPYVGVVADELGRDAVLVELSPEYAAMAERRVSGVRARRMIGDAPRNEPLPGQLDLLT